MYCTSSRRKSSRDLLRVAALPLEQPRERLGLLAQLLLEVRLSRHRRAAPPPPRATRGCRRASRRSPRRDAAARPASPVSTTIDAGDIGGGSHPRVPVRVAHDDHVRRRNGLALAHDGRRRASAPPRRRRCSRAAAARRRAARRSSATSPFDLERAPRRVAAPPRGRRRRRRRTRPRARAAATRPAASRSRSSATAATSAALDRVDRVLAEVVADAAARRRRRRARAPPPPRRRRSR